MPSDLFTHEIYPNGTIRNVVNLATLYRKGRLYGAEWINFYGNVLTVRYGGGAGDHQSVWASADVLQHSMTHRRSFLGVQVRQHPLPLFAERPAATDRVSAVRPETWQEFCANAEDHTLIQSEENALFMYVCTFVPNSFTIIAAGRVLNCYARQNADALFNALAIKPISL